MKHVVIAGAGFAGVRLARKLRKQKNIRITLVNDSEDFRYSPALYRAATGFKVGTARIPLEWMLLDSSNTELVIGTVTQLDEAKKSIHLASGQIIEYDYVVMALGAVTTYFGIEGLDKHSYGIKTFEEIVELKHHIHDNLASKSSKEQNFVIVGAGPTGIELAGALGFFLKRIAKKHRVKRPHLKVYLVEAGPLILPQLSAAASRKAHRQLTKLGIHILVDTKVKSETINSLRTSNGTIKTRNVIWTAGTASNPIFKKYPKIFSLDKRGRVLVDKHLQVSSSIYVCGDNAATRFSGLAVTAINHANYLAHDITARVRHKNRPILKEKYPIQAVPAGFRWSVLQYRRFVMAGRLASVARRVADIVGYTEILGPIRAMTIWKNSDLTEEQCTVCRSR